MSIKCYSDLSAQLWQHWHVTSKMSHHTHTGCKMPHVWCPPLVSRPCWLERHFQLVMLLTSAVKLTYRPRKSPATSLANTLAGLVLTRKFQHAYKPYLFNLLSSWKIQTTAHAALLRSGCGHIWTHAWKHFSATARLAQHQRIIKQQHPNRQQHDFNFFIRGWRS